MERFQQQTERTEEDFASELIDRITADIDFLWMRSSKSLIFNYGYGCFFSLNVGGGSIGITYIFIPEQQRKKGNATKILKHLMKVAKEMEAHIWLVANPFRASGFDLSKHDLIDFEYEQDEEVQQIMVKLVQKLGFKERNIGLAMNLYEVMGRAIFYKYSNPPRLFIFNDPNAGPDYEEEGIDKEVWNRRLKDFEERFYDEAKVVHP